MRTILLFLTLSSPPASTDPACFAKLLCAIKENIRWRTPAWSAETCEKLGAAIQSAAEDHKLNPHLLLGILVNESELDERSHRDAYRDGKLVARDGGLGGVHCVLSRDGRRCVNTPVRGMSWQQVMDPIANIEVTARELAHYRDGGAASWQIVKVVDRGRQRPQRRVVVCRHKNHAWWAHYNHGVRYIDRGPARHYGHRVAVLYAALLRVSEEPITDELRRPITIVDKGKKPRSIDKPVGTRQQRLVEQIAACAGTCSRLAAR